MAMRLKWYLDEEEKLIKLGESIRDYSLFERQGLSKPIEFQYNLQSFQPWIYFNNQEDERLSFRAHSLQLGDEDALYWHMGAQEGYKAKFEGFTPRFHFPGSRLIRGSVSLPKGFRPMGIVVRNGKLTEIRPWAAREEAMIPVVNVFYHFIKSLS